MKAAIVYASYHRRNTEKIANAIASILDGQEFPILRLQSIPDLSDYDVIAIGSGIYKWKFHPKLLAWIEKLPAVDGKPVILFSTSSFRNEAFHKSVSETLENKGYEVIGHFHCKGSTNILPKFMAGGMVKDKPGLKEINEAKHFAEKMKERMKFRT